MKLVIKHPDGCPIGARTPRRVVGDISFTQRGTDELSSYEIRRTPVAFDGEISIIVEASYTPANRVLSIIAGHLIAEEEVKFFSAVTEFEYVPTSFCAYLPTGQYIEFYIEGEAPKCPELGGC